MLSFDPADHILALPSLAFLAQGKCWARKVRAFYKPVSHVLPAQLHHSGDVVKS